MQQLPLAIPPVGEPSFENFIAGGNAEALARVRALALGESAEAIVYLWGGAGSGRSHLLRAAARAASEARGLTVRDDVQSLDAPAQAELFTRINEAREGRGAVLAAGDAPPAALGLREDLRTRLAWGLVYQLQPLTDAEKEAFLREEAGRRGLRMPDEVVRYVLTHLPRDLVSLHKAIERIDRHSLARHRQVTLALAREALADPRTR